MITIKDYAKSRNISYEAVRQSIKRHKAELAEHISKQGKTQYLNDIAVGILDKYRNKGTVSVSVFEQSESNQELIDGMKNQIILLQQQIIDLQRENQLGIEAKAKLQMIEANIEDLTTENKQLKEENNSYQRTVFGLYRKKKTV